MEELEAEISQAIASAVNDLAQTILEDIQGHVRVKSGALRDSYVIASQATAENPEAVVGSSLPYAGEHYPEVPQRASQPGGLFVEPIAFDGAAADAVERKLNG